jgi:aminopeptidase YwaD
MKRFLFFPAFLICIFSPVHIPAQDKVYAHAVIDTLASPSMHGRGYVNNGDKIAAKYIADQYKGFGLISYNLTGNYYQQFSFPINTFPGAMDVSLVLGTGQKQKLRAGEEFLVRPESPSVKGRYKVMRLDSALIYDQAKWDAFMRMNLKKYFVLVDTSGVRGRKELTYMTDYVKYRRNVKGILLPVRLNLLAGSNNCSKLSPWDMSMFKSTIPVIEIEEIYIDVKEIEVNIAAKFIKNYTSQNVAGYIKGSQYPDSFIVFTAHYDHLGQMGKDVYFPGANDNASGVAMLLSLARYYSQETNKPKCSMAFIAFGGEEVGLLGSKHFTEHPLFPLASIRFLINMDILGTGEEGITVVNATIFDYQFKKLKELNAAGNYLSLVKPRGKAPISDHYFFTERKVPCFYIYTLGGIKAYHDPCDRRETLPLNKFEELFSLLRDFTNWIDR